VKLAHFHSILFVLLVCSANSQDLENIGQQKPIKFSGSLSAFTDFYAVSGIAPRSTPFNWRITGTPTIQLYGISFPFYFNIGSQNKSFAQPFNQFGVSPKYKWITVHGGWRSLSYSQYTLSGMMFLGGGLELTPGKFRFAAMYGRFTRAVREDVAQQFITSVPVYERKGYSAKIGVGTAQNFFDLILFKAKDDTLSFPNAPSTLNPAENVVLGMNSRFLILKHVQVTMEAATSGYTRDTELQIPDGDIYNKLRPVLYTNASTQLLFAGNASIGYVSKYVNLRTRYRRVDQDYKSMGAYMFENDVEAVTIEPSFNMFKSKFRLSGSIGQQRDNLLGRKMVTTQRTIGSVNLSINPGKVYGIDLQYSNYGIAQRAGVIPINDTTRMAIANQNINIINRFSFINKERVLMIMLMNVYQDMRNLNPISPAFIESNVFITNLNMNYTLLRSKTSIIVGINYSQNTFAMGKVLMHGPMIGLSKVLLNGKLSTNFSGSCMINKFSETSDSGLTYTGNLTMNYQVTKMHGFLVNARTTSNRASNPISIPFTEGYFTIGYQLSLK